MASVMASFTDSVPRHVITTAWREWSTVTEYATVHTLSFAQLAYNKSTSRKPD